MDVASFFCLFNFLMLVYFLSVLLSKLILWNYRDTIFLQFQVFSIHFLPYTNWHCKKMLYLNNHAWHNQLNAALLTFIVLTTANEHPCWININAIICTSRCNYPKMKKWKNYFMKIIFRFNLWATRAAHKHFGRLWLWKCEKTKGLQCNIKTYSYICTSAFKCKFS